MNALTTYVAAAALVATATPAISQVSKTLPGETHVATATVEAIERSTREVTVKKSDGQYEGL
jgi:DNA-binding transcriptional regulator YdaS (Cro superfamily)